MFSVRLKVVLLLLQLLSVISVINLVVQAHHAVEFAKIVEVAFVLIVQQLSLSQSSSADHSA